MWPGKSLGIFTGSKDLENEFFGMDGWTKRQIWRAGNGIEICESLARSPERSSVGKSWLLFIYADKRNYWFLEGEFHC